MSSIRPSLHHTPSERNLEVMAKRALKASLKDTYDADIKQRKAKELQMKQMERARDVMFLQMNQSYSPWGRGGGGAPLRDNSGDTISDLTQVYHAERLPVEAPLSPPQNSSDNALIKSNYDGSRAFKKNGSRIIQDALIQRMEERHRSIREAFLASDRDRSGYLDGHEIKRLCQLYNLDTTQVNAIVERCDVDYNGMISYNEFCQTLVREDYPIENDTNDDASNVRTTSMSTSMSRSPSLKAHRRQLRDGATSPTSLSPPFNAEMSHGRKSLGPSDDGNGKSPGGGGGSPYGGGSSAGALYGSGSAVRPRNLKSTSPTSGKGASFYVNAPETPERLLAERKRKKLIDGLDSQVRERRKKREEDQLDELRRTLVSQQRLVNQGLDYWGQPIPEGDPRQFAELMAVNTMEQIHASGLSTLDMNNGRLHHRGAGEVERGRQQRFSPRSELGSGGGGGGSGGSGGRGGGSGGSSGEGECLDDASLRVLRVWIEHRANPNELVKSLEGRLKAMNAWNLAQQGLKVLNHARLSVSGFRVDEKIKFDIIAFPRRQTIFAAPSRQLNRRVDDLYFEAGFERISGTGGKIFSCGIEGGVYSVSSSKSISDDIGAVGITINVQRIIKWNLEQLMPNGIVGGGNNSSHGGVGGLINLVFLCTAGIYNGVDHLVDRLRGAGIRSLCGYGTDPSMEGQLIMAQQARARFVVEIQRDESLKLVDYLVSTQTKKKFKDVSLLIDFLKNRMVAS